METLELQDVKTKLKTIMIKDLEVPQSVESIQDDISLYEDGIGLDSISIVNLIVLIEKNFNIKFGEDEISAKHFQNINSLASFVNSKLASA